MENILFHIRRGTLFFLVIFICLQLFTYPCIEVGVGLFVSLLSLILFNNYVLTKQTITERPLSFLAMLGLQLFTLFAPILTYLDGNPITYKMRMPTETFIWQLLYICITLLAFNTSYKYSRKSPYIRNALKRIGYFSAASDRALWILALVGLAGRLYLIRNQFGDTMTAGAGTVNMFIPFIYAPYCILFKELYSQNSSSKVNKWPYIIYSIFLILLGVTTNSRNSIVTVFMTCMLMYLFYVTNYRKDLFLRMFSMTKKKFLLILFLLLILTGPLSNLAIAMVSVRYMRKDLSPQQLLKETVELAFNQEEMEKIKQVSEKKSLSVEERNMDWDEGYVNNVFFQRICNYAVADASLHHAYRAGVPSERMWNDCWERLKIIYPTPIARFLFGDIDKENYQYSDMDYLLSISTHSTNRKSYLVGGDVGLGLASFGYLFILFQFIVYFIMFYYLDQLTYTKNGRTVIPVLTLIALYGFLYTFMQGRGIWGRFTGLLWGVPFGIICKTIIYKIFSRLFK